MRAFPDDLRDWVEASLAEVPSDVRAFAFNLYETGGDPEALFGVELVGAESFSEDDPDWACDEVWEATPRGIGIPRSYSGRTWEDCLEVMKAAVGGILDADSRASSVLKRAEGVGIGFVDGDMETLWKRG